MIGQGYKDMVVFRKTFIVEKIKIIGVKKKTCTRHLFDKIYPPF